MIRLLYYHPICPFSRLVRVLLAEKSLDSEIKYENYWERNEELGRLNPAMELPIFIDENQAVICNTSSIIEYLEEIYPEHNYLGTTALERAEVRRIFAWFTQKFYNEVTKYIINERILCFYANVAAPNSEAIRAAKHNMFYHLDYIGFLLNKRKKLAGNELTIADFAAAAQLSLLDYFGDVDWDYNQTAREWYALIKSRPSFKPILAEIIAGFIPVAHYTNLDF